MVETKVARWRRARSGTAERAISVSRAGARRARASRRRAVAERGERFVHGGPVPREVRLELRHRSRAAEAQPAGERQERRGLARYELRAALLNDLELVLDVAQEAIGRGERRREPGLH